MEISAGLFSQLALAAQTTPLRLLFTADSQFKPMLVLSTNVATARDLLKVE